jgi:hypothetical protein
VRTLLRRGRSGMESTALRAADLELDRCAAAWYAVGSAST